MSSYISEMAFAQEMAADAGKIMKKYFRSEDIDTQWKADHTPLTVADNKINDLLIERVEKNYPDHGVIGEESSYMEERDMVWVVDPIDGTAPYSLGIPTSTFCLALVDRSDGQPVIAVVYDPFQRVDAFDIERRAAGDRDLLGKVGVLAGVVVR